MAELSLSNVINVSVAAVPAAVGVFSTGNIALFSTETPDPVFDDDYKLYKEATEVGVDFGTDSQTYEMAVAVFSQSPNILTADGYLAVFPFEPSETLEEAIVRTAGIVSYFGVMSTQIESEQDMLDAAALIQALNKVGFFVQRASASIDPGGSLDLLRTGGLTKSRGLYYGSDNDSDALNFMAAYASRGLSVNYSGTNTTLDMQLKVLATIQPDPTLTQTLYDKAKTAGADVYASLEGSPGVLTSGANKFFDQVSNIGWFVAATQIAGFNFLRSTASKVPQTDAGVDALISAYKQVGEQAVQNRYVAPGVWTDPIPFGDPTTFLQNIADFGYYYFALPVGSQSKADREQRKAPLIQIAIKEAGGIDSSNIIININA